LVVDDNASFLELLGEILVSADARLAPHMVRTGTEAFAFLEHAPPFEHAPRPAFVILDFDLPDLDAVAVLRWLRSRQAFRTVPVLVVSQADWQEEQRAAWDAGATGFLVKPFAISALRDAVLRFWWEHVT